MGSISGLKSNLLLVRPVHLQHPGSKPEKKNDFLLRKRFLISTIDKEHNKQVAWQYCWGLENSPSVITS